jgi:hypothetical protein
MCGLYEVLWVFLQISEDVVLVTINTYNNSLSQRKDEEWICVFLDLSLIGLETSTFPFIFPLEHLTLEEVSYQVITLKPPCCEKTEACPWRGQVEGRGEGEVPTSFKEF